jgi:hypothetical protein
MLHNRVLEDEPRVHLLERSVHILHVTQSIQLRTDENALARFTVEEDHTEGAEPSAQVSRMPFVDLLPDRNDADFGASRKP